MKRVPDRKKLRQEYLRTKATGYVELIANVVALPVLVLLCLVLGAAGLTMLRDEIMAPIAFTVLFLAALCGYYTWRAFHDLRKAKSKVTAAYVPPVIPSTLPAEEVLVRSASEPSAPSETLLRATVKGEETKAEELLRVASGTTRE